MSNQQPNRPQGGPARQGMAPAPSGSGPGAAFDPIKMLQKYKYVLVAAIIFGVFFGYGSHVLLRKFMPGFKSTVLFKCTPVETDIQVMASATIDEDEMARFMGTQVQLIKGEQVIASVVADPRLEAEAPNWYAQFVRRGNFDIIEAYEELEKIIRAGALPNTYLIQLSIQVGDPNDAAGLAGLIRENYTRNLSTINNSNVTKRKELIRRAISDADETLKELTSRKNRIIQEQDINTINSEQSNQAEMLSLVNAQIINNQAQIDSTQVILALDEAQLKRDGAVQYDSTLREQVENSPAIMNLKQQVTTLKTTMLALKAEGIKTEHRSYRQVINQLEATERELENTREALLSNLFEARIDSTRLMLKQLRAQIEEFMSKSEELQTKLNELTRTSEEIEEIRRQTDSTLSLKAEYESDLAELGAAAGLDTANRIQVSKRENVPDRPSFPVLKIMIPAGVFLITGLTAGLIVIFEVMDQRIKSAADVAMIPRTRILGIIPDADEDPANHTSIETLFMDSPNSVLAEHFRQLRTKITKSMGAHGHKTLLVAGAMPGSGATSVATNIAQACMAAGKNTLIIDTNFRRARIHTAFGLLESPGLGEALAGDQPITDCIQKTTTKGPDVMAAGARNLRVVERLGTQAMGQVLAEVSTMYDVVILDVAPAIVAGDAITLSSQVDATMLVVRAMSEKRGQVARLKNELSDNRAEFLGVLVNGVRSSAGGYMRKNIRTSHQYQALDNEQTS